MKISVLITTMLIVQVSSTSFFDLFHGAVQSVQNGFGKLLTDVVTDVKETVDCTILAVQQMLSLSEDATRRYYEKCGNGMNSTSTDGNTTSVEGLQPVNEENLEKEIDEKINKTVSKVLDDYKPDEKIIELERLLVKESEQLADVNDLLKKEIKKLSEEVGKDFKNMTYIHNDTESSVETILHEIKVLEKKELNTRNTSEAKEIHHVMSEVLDKIDAIEATEATENVKLDEIVGDLQNKSKDNSIVILKHEIKEWEEEESQNLGELKKEVEEHERIIDRPKIEPECNHTQPVIFNMGIPKDPTTRSINSRELSSKNISQARVISDGDSNYKPLSVSKSSNETTELVELTKRVNPDTEPSTTSSPTMNKKIINENKSNETIKMDNVYVNTESVANKSSDYMANNDTVIIREDQRTNVELNSTIQDITKSGNTNNTETAGKSINAGTTSTEKVLSLAVPANETVTSANIESTFVKPPENNFTNTHLTSIPLFLYDDFFPAEKSIQPEELTTIRNEENTTITAKPIDTVTPDLPMTVTTSVSETILPELLTASENTDNTTVTTETNDKVTPNPSITYSSPGNEDNPTVTTEPYNPLTSNPSVTDSARVSITSTPEELTTPGNDDNSTITAEPNDTVTANLPVIDSLPASENILLVEITTMVNEDNPTITTEPNDAVTTNLPAIDSLPASENIPLFELTTMGNEDSSTINAEPDDKVTINLPITDSLPVSETISAEKFSTANSDNPTVNTEPNESVTPNQSMIESSPNENIPLEELTTVDSGDNSTLTTDTNDAVTPTLSMTDSSPVIENIPPEEITTAANEDNPTVTTELNDTVTPDVSITGSTPASETVLSDVTSAIPDDKESIQTATNVNDSTVVTQNSTYTTNTSEEGITPCCKDFEETLKRSINENTTSSTAAESSPPTDTQELAIVRMTETAGTTLTTQIPTLRTGLVDNKNASFDYDSFFPSQTNKEVRQRAIKEARQLMKGRKRSERIINNILKNKRKGTVSLFSGPVPINSGK